LINVAEIFYYITKCLSTCVWKVQNLMNVLKFVQIETFLWIQMFSFVLVY